MASGFRDLLTLVPTRLKNRERSGYVTVESVRSGRLVVDTAALEAVTDSLQQRHLCLVVAPRNRGKTVFAKAFGVKFGLEPNRVARFASMSELRVDDAINEIKT